MYVRLMLIDTDLEKEIGLGADYPFGPLEAGECVVADVWKSRNYAEGDKLNIKAGLFELINNMAYQYDINYPKKSYADQNC